MKNDRAGFIAKFLGCTALSVGVSLFLHDQNNTLDITHRMVQLRRLPAAFHGFRIAHLSDLHSKWFGKDQRRLIDALRAQQPDIIVITGDLVDKRRDWHGDFSAGLTLVRRAVQIAPVYYVSGNHEWQGGLYSTLMPQLVEAGAVVLDNRAQMISRGDARLLLLGLADAASIAKDGSQKTTTLPKQRPKQLPCHKRISTGKRAVMQARLKHLCAGQENTCKILLSHRPHLMELYTWAGVDLVLSGHAHGGQVRVPGIGGLYAPHQGFFPHFTEGTRTRGDTTLEISRGLGNSGCPQRLFNHPELVMVRLACK